MGASADEIDRQMKEAREHIDENLGVLEERASASAVRYGRIAAVIVGVIVVSGAGVLIYRRMTRPTRPQQVRSTVIAALRDLPDAVRGLSGEVSARLHKRLPIKVVVSGRTSGDPGTLEKVARRVAPAVAASASSALVERFTRSSDSEDARSRSTAPAFD